MCYIVFTTFCVAHHVCIMDMVSCYTVLTHILCSIPCIYSGYNVVLHSIHYILCSTPWILSGYGVMLHSIYYILCCTPCMYSGYNVVLYCIYYILCSTPCMYSGYNVCFIVFTTSYVAHHLCIVDMLLCYI